MTADRVKFQVWSPDLALWKTVYVREHQLQANINWLVSYGFYVRVGGRGGKYYYVPE